MKPTSCFGKRHVASKPWKSLKLLVQAPCNEVPVKLEQYTMRCNCGLMNLIKRYDPNINLYAFFLSFPPALAVTLSLQNFLRCQNNKTNYNLVCETLQFLDCICGSTTGGLGLLGLYINEKNVALINQTLESLTEYCQGPCHENQVTCL